MFLLYLDCTQKEKNGCHKALSLSKQGWKCRNLPIKEYVGKENKFTENSGPSDASLSNAKLNQEQSRCAVAETWGSGRLFLCPSCLLPPSGLGRAALVLQGYPKAGATDLSLHKDLEGCRFTKQAKTRRWLVSGTHRAILVVHSHLCSDWWVRLNNVGYHPCKSQWYGLNRLRTDTPLEGRTITQPQLMLPCGNEGSALRVPTWDF